MNRVWKRTLHVCLLASLTLLPASHAAAEFPERPIAMIVPWQAGGSTDQTTRLLAKAAEAHLGQPIVVINKPGASSTIGLAEIAGAKPDGYTVGLFTTTGYLLPLSGRTVSYDVEKSFTWISTYTENMIGIAVLAESRWKTLKDLLDEGRKNPGKIRYGTAGIGTTQHLTMEAVSAAAKAKFTHVPQKGGAAVMAALLGKHLDFMIDVSVWAPHVQAGAARLLALGASRRAEGLSDVPTLNELGFERILSFLAIIGPAGIPPVVQQKLESAFRKATADEAFQQAVKRLYMQVYDLSGKDTERMVKEEMERAKVFISRMEK